MVRMVLARVAKTGLPGEHHFYIAFDTQAPGVSLSKRLREKYPKEMTVVLQHRFWDLGVSDDRFEVKLTFDGIPERLSVPVRRHQGLLRSERALRPAIRRIGSRRSNAHLRRGGRGRSRQPSKLEKKPRAPRKPRPDKSLEPPRSERPLARPQIVASKPDSGDASNENKVVCIDAFRKK